MSETALDAQIRLLGALRCAADDSNARIAKLEHRLSKLEQLNARLSALESRSPITPQVIALTEAIEDVRQQYPIPDYDCLRAKESEKLIKEMWRKDMDRQNAGKPQHEWSGSSRTFTYPPSSDLNIQRAVEQLMESRGHRLPSELHIAPDAWRKLKIETGARDYIEPNPNSSSYSINTSCGALKVVVDPTLTGWVLR